MEDNRYLEQAVALLHKAKNAGEIMSLVLVTAGRKSCFKAEGSGAALINAMIGLRGQGGLFDSILALVVATWETRSAEFALKTTVLVNNPKELKRLLEEASDKLDAEIAEANAKRESPEDETEKEESHDSEEAA